MYNVGGFQVILPCFGFMAAVDQPDRNEIICTPVEEIHDNTRPISSSVSSTDLLSVSASSSVYRLVVVSSKIRQPTALQTASLNGVSILIYQQDAEDLNTLLLKIKEACSRNKPASIAFLAHGHPGSMVLCSLRGEKVSCQPGIFLFIKCKISTFPIALRFDNISLCMNGFIRPKTFKSIEIYFLGSINFSCFLSNDQIS